VTPFALATFAVFALATVLSALLVPASSRIAARLGALDDPGPRKIHRQATPRMGGIAVYVAFLGIVLTGYYAWRVVVAQQGDQQLLALFAPLTEAHRVESKLLAVIAGATIAFLVGALDDVLGTRFPVAWKGIGQILAATILVVADVRTSFLPWDWLNALLTIFWVVGITNAFNLLDNMDGLSGGVAFVASGVLFVNAWALGELFVSLILAAFMGSLLGFLFFNYNPAKVFLGDCGSLFIGYTMAALTLLERYVSHASSTVFPVLMPVLVLAVPIIDTTTVVLIRLREHRPIYVGDARHLSHRLLSLGFSQRASVAFIYLVTLCLGLGAIGLSDASLSRSAVIMLQSAGFVALILILLFYERRHEPRDSAP
jgi:UDP-GlcNAc:undecaprenyl-phosphate/decaprenyl-phosphate GlcNAc-1-phosphate transferase